MTMMFQGLQPVATKGPASSLVYGVDVAAVLAPGDALSGTPTVTATGVTLGAAAYDGTIVKARISGGTEGQTVSVCFGWQTAGGDIDSRTVHLRIAKR